MKNIFHKIVNPISTCLENVQGYIDLAASKSTNYSLILDDLIANIDKESGKYQAKAKYTGLNCYRPTTDLISNLNDQHVCKDFKPEHARIIIGLDTLEKSLDFANKDQVKIYLSFFSECMEAISK